MRNNYFLSLIVSSVAMLLSTAHTRASVPHPIQELQCYENLTQNFNDSAHYSMNVSLVLSNQDERMDAAMALLATNLVYANSKCEDVAQPIDVKCSSELTPTSPICRVNGPRGYFIVLKDFVDTVHVIFNRWD